MPLNDLSLDELRGLSRTICALERVGLDLEQVGLGPVFDLSPGAPMRITVSAKMPEAPPSVSVTASYLLVAEPNAPVQHSSTEAASYRADEEASRAPAPLEPAPAEAGVDPPPVAGEATGGTLFAEARSRSGDAADPPPAAAEVTPPPVAEAASSEGAAERGGGQVMAAAEPSAVPPDTHQARLLPPNWTPEEEDRLVNMVALGVLRLGMTKMAAIIAAARELGRPEAGTAFRARHKLKQRIDATLAEGDAYLDQPEAAPEPVPAVEASSQAAKDAAEWTEAEDRIVIDEVVSAALSGGHSPQSAIAGAAFRTGRSWRSIEARLNTTLQGRVEAELTAAAMEQAQTEIPETPSPECVDAVAPLAEPPQAGDTAVGGQTPAAVQDAPAPASVVADAVTGHLMSLPDKGGWTLERDLELMELSIAGWKPNEIALQLQVQANAIQPRFDALTGQYVNADDKKVRRFTREAVFAALTRLAGKAA